MGGWAPWRRRAGRRAWGQRGAKVLRGDGGELGGRVLAQAVSMGDLLSSEAAKHAGSYSGGASAVGSDPGRDSAFLDSLFYGGGRRALQFSFFSGQDIISDVAASAASSPSWSSRRTSPRSYSTPTPDSLASEEAWVLRLLNPFTPEQDDW